MRRLILLTIAICISKFGFTQSDFRPGYLITTAGDTISGLVDFREGSKAHESCDYKKSETQNIVTYQPNELFGYGFVNDKFFESRKIQEKDEAPKVVFLEVLVNGIVSLYKFKSTYYMEKNREGIHQLSNESKAVVREGRNVLRHTNQHIGVMSMLLFDCVDIRPRIEKVRLNEKSLSILVEDYNKCMGGSTVTYKADKPWMKWFFGITGGMNFSQIDFDDRLVPEHLKGSYEPSKSPTMGISLDILSPRLSERISFHGDILYLTSKYHHSNTFEYSLFTRRNYVTIELQQLKLPIGFRYTFPTKTITPYLSLGLSSTIHLRSRSTWVQETQFTTYVETFKDKALEIDNDQLGFWGGFGVLKSIHRKYNAFLEVRYEQTDGIGKNTTIQHFKAISNVVNFQVIVGVRTK